MTHPDKNTYKNSCPEEQRGESNWIRKDLRCFTSVFSKPNLREALEANGIRRVLEVGAAQEFDAIRQLIRLVDETETPYFKKNDLWTADPNSYINPLVSQYIPEYGFITDNAIIQPVFVEEIAQSISTGEVMPFDLVFSKGVASIGNLNEDCHLSKTREKAFTLIKIMMSCMNPDNQNSTLILSAKFGDTVLPYCRIDLENLELQIIGFNEAKGLPAKNWLHALQIGDYFPKSPTESFYNVVVCKRK